MGNSNKKPTDGAPSYKGKKFSKSYMLARELGRGAFSIVKLGVNKQTGDNVAVKIVSTKKIQPDELASLHTEIGILQSLEHPNIIKLIEVFEEGSEFYIVTELVQGGELFDRIVSKSHYSEKEARDLIKKLLETLAYMHESNVVHRDLKPENLLLTKDDDDGDIKVADFGFAKKITDLEVQEIPCGTPGYVAPEILRGDQYSKEVDIWSLGVICYVLLAGYPPFYDDDQRNLFKKIKEANYHFHADYWGSISAEVQDLIRKMLTLDQKLRWSARQLLSHPWITAGDEELAGRDLTGSLSELKRYNARRRLRAAANTVIMTNRIARLTNFGSKQNSGLTGKSEETEQTDTTDNVHREGSKVGDSDYKPPSSSIET